VCAFGQHESVSYVLVSTREYRLGRSGCTGSCCTYCTYIRFITIADIALLIALVVKTGFLDHLTSNN